jgi:hypothetical protein
MRPGKGAIGGADICRIDMLVKAEFCYRQINSLNKCIVVLQEHILTYKSAIHDKVDCRAIP